MKLNDEVLQSFKGHVLACYPEEACGLVVNDVYVPCKNAADEPLKDFRISGPDLITARLSGKIQAVLHSHPYDGMKPRSDDWPADWPSGKDMQNWLGDDIPWGIVATDGEDLNPIVWLDDANPEPLIGRQFIHGVNDCYSVVRDWFRQERGITLKNFARGYGWWDTDQNLYAKNFAAAGFEEIELDHLQVGDCVLMALGSDVLRHAAVVTGPNEILHHKINRLSGRESLSKWHRSIVKAVRFNPELLKEQE
jgi:proteasome lid subunit RPN8/RPN11